MTSSAPRKILPQAEWPGIDRQQWNTALAPGDDLDDDNYATTLRPMTLRNACRGYGRFLAILDANGRLDPTARPAERLTWENASFFLRTLRQGNNANSTIQARFWELQIAAKIMEPGQNWRWLTKPKDVPLRTLFPAAPTIGEARDSKELYDWGMVMMDRAPPGRKGDIAYRNGLIIAILAPRAPRLRAMAAIRLGRNLVFNDGRYRLTFLREDMKNRRYIEYDLPDKLTPYVERYLSEVRPRLLRGRQHDFVLVGILGAPLREAGIERMIRRGSEIQFGKAFGPHSFRHSLASSHARVESTNPGVAAAILAVTTGVVDGHYNRARTEDAVHRYQQAVMEERQLAFDFFRLAEAHADELEDVE